MHSVALAGVSGPRAVSTASSSHQRASCVARASSQDQGARINVGSLARTGALVSAIAVGFTVAQSAHAADSVQDLVQNSSHFNVRGTCARVSPLFSGICLGTLARSPIHGVGALPIRCGPATASPIGPGSSLQVIGDVADEANFWANVVAYVRYFFSVLLGERRGRPPPCLRQAPSLPHPP